MTTSDYLEEAARLGVDVEIERHDEWFVRDMLRELRALPAEDLLAGIRAVNDGATPDDLDAYRVDPRLDVAERAYLRQYGAGPDATDHDRQWARYCSSEDALFGVLRGLFPADYSEGDFEKVRGSEPLQGLCERLWEWESEGLRPGEIVARLVPEIDTLRERGQA
jgi:hypothetical protein